MTPYLLTLVVPGAPVAQARGRITTIGGKPRIYTTAAVRHYSEKVQAAAVDAMQGKEGFPLDGPLAVRMTFYMERPKGRKRAFWADRKPDLDNLEKLVLDALEKAGAYVNDSRVVYKVSTKKYDDAPRVVVEIWRA